MNISELTRLLKADTMPKRCSIGIHTRIAVYQQLTDRWLKVSDYALATGISNSSVRVALNDLKMGGFVEESSVKTGESLNGRFRNKDIAIFRRNSHNVTPDY